MSDSFILSALMARSFTRAQLEKIIEAAIDALDALDGDSDCEHDPAEDDEEHG